MVGAGTMGAGIAAHLANLGFGVSLVDVTRERVEESIERIRSGPRNAFMTPLAHGMIEAVGLGELDAAVAKADWVCEAIIERLEAKRELWARVDACAGPTTMLTTNTSGLPIAQLAEGRSSDFKRRFMGAHFFNPPRYLKLVELIATADTDPDEVRRAISFFESFVARRVVPAKDTPGFIANRFGMWALFQAIHTAERLHLTVEQTDLFSGALIGRPRSGTFALADMIGIDVMLDIASGLKERCPADPQIKILETPTSILSLRSRDWLGDKTGQGYYRRQSKEAMALDLTTMAYRMVQPEDSPTISALCKLPLGERLVKALEAKDEAGEFVRNHLLPTLRYADALKEEISYSVRDFDRVMKWGWGWEMGPFELIDAIGADRVGVTGKHFYSGASYVGFDGKTVNPPAEPEYATLHDFPIVDTKNTFNVRDIGDGILAVSSTTKLGVITPEYVDELTAFLDEHKNPRIVLTSEARSFSAGYDITVFERAIEANNFDTVDPALKALQALGERLNAAGAVAAVFGHCLGAGLELAISCSTVVAAAESKLGFPEAKIGLVPAGRGTVLMRMQHSHAAQKLADVAIALTEGRVSQSAPEAATLGYLRTSDVVVYLQDRLLWEAKQVALRGKSTPAPEWTPLSGPLGGMLDRALGERRTRGALSDYDVSIGERIKAVFVKSSSYADALNRERAEFLELLNKPFTQVRIKHMREQGTPLRN